MRRDRPARRPAARRPARPLLAAAAVAAAALSGGCQSMHRRLSVQSDPPGALVLVDGRRIGVTPTSVTFDYYGGREITLVKDGFETQTFTAPVDPPFYQVPPLDFVTDNFVPTTIEDRRVIRRRLVPTRPVPTDGVLLRADELRNRSRIGG